MKIKDIFNIKNISHFIEGYSKYFYDNLVGLPDYIREQIVYRLFLCKDDCVPNKKCKYCGCNPTKKVFVSTSCNNGERFPDLMNKEDWEKFKEKNNIE